MADSDYIIQTLGRIEERQVKNSEGIAEIRANINNIMHENTQCRTDREQQDDRISTIESNQRVQNGILAAAIAVLPFLAPTLEWLKNKGII
jgi:regulator of replication initiation timing